jgi:hypothetical protein
MKATNCLTRITAVAVTCVVIGPMSARATITLTIPNNGLGLSTLAVGMKSPDGVTVNEGAEGGYIGVYGFQVNAIDSTIAAETGLTVNSTFNSVCLSPSGTLYAGTQYTYNYESFTSASPGLNPTGDWSANGIVDAAWLWNKYGGTVSTADQGAGLALAMLELLYNGGPNGTYVSNPNATQFAPNFYSDNNAHTAYTGYLQDFVNAGSAVSSPATYGIFVPTSSSGQEFIFISPVPEPTTLIAGALLLLPFGASTLRIVRRNRAA